jgi:uncharacterized protein (TIGR03118 family)
MEMLNQLFCWSRLLLCYKCLLTLTTALAANLTVDIQNFAFVPRALTVAPGDTVTWMNKDVSEHTSTSGTPTAPDGLWNSGALAQGQTFSFTFTNAGNFPYFCSFHSMLGSVTVQSTQPTGPAISITSPANDTTISAAGPVTFTASAAATGGTISQVEFLEGTTSLGVVTSSPYTLDVNLVAGAHTITARATDSNGATTTSTAITLTVGGGGTKISDPIPTKIPKGDISVDLELVADGFSSPIGMAAPDDGTGRLFVYDQVGFVYLVNSNGVKSPTPVLDVRDRLVQIDGNYDERGLIGLATHPNFAQHPLIYTYTSEPNGPMADFMIMYSDGTTNNHQSVISEWKIDPTNPDRVDPASRREILRVDKPEANHNGGTLRFGPDGFLYFTIGDGGAADDQGPGHSPGGNGQDKSKILGKISRIDVDARTSPNGQYGIPQDNPFIGQAGVVNEIYAYGLRNPYSFSFDRTNGTIYLADVGQNDVEEIDVITKGGNFGWPIKEGSFFFDPNGTANGFVTTQPVRAVPPDLIDPIGEFDHDEGDAIIGGYLYRGSRISAVSGKYVCASWGEFESATGRLFYLDGSQLKEFKIGVDDHALGMWVKGFGEDPTGELYVFGSVALGPSGTSGVMLKLLPAGTAPISTNSYLQKNLVSDLPDFAPITDTNLVNPWGLIAGPTTPFWISDNHSGLSTLYDSTGAVQSLVVTIPPPANGTPPSAPTGVIYNNTTNFLVGTNPARFIFAAEDGTITAWNSGISAVLKVDNSGSDAIYKGLALANSGGNDYLYATDFKGGKIDVFDSNFQPAKLAGAFTDPGIPAGFAPFNIRNIAGSLYVTYAQQDADKEDDVAGDGNGFIDIFDPAGNMIKRFASNGPLNSPWGMAVAPSSFGAFAGALLVGNFGDGRISAFDLNSGTFLGQLKNPNGILVWADGLWDLLFGNGNKGGDANTLYFTAGISGGGGKEGHGLFGSVQYDPQFSITRVAQNGDSIVIDWTARQGAFMLQKKAHLSDASWTDVQLLTDASVTLKMDGPSAFFRIVQKSSP